MSSDLQVPKTSDASRDPAVHGSYLARRPQSALIFGSFFFVLLPLLLVAHVHAGSAFVQWLLMAHAIGLGLTHFLLTFVLYFQGAHLTYFSSTPRNRVVFWLIPLGALVAFGLAAALELRSRAPATMAIALGLVRLLDFFHVGRQSFGVLQMFKAGAAGRSRRSENAFFVALALVQWMTFASGGRFDPRMPWLVVGAIVLSFGFVFVCSALLEEDLADARIRGALVYFVLQAIAGALAVYDTRLYLLGLTLHYVEYHVVMLPRWRDAPLDLAQRLDRGFARVRRRGWLFYGLLLGAALVLHVTSGAPTRLGSLQLVPVLDGIFLAHYAVEAFLWRSREPFFRAHVAPLYRARPQDGEHARGARSGARELWA